MALADKKLTDLDELIVVPSDAWIHVVDPNDISQSSEGSSKKTKKINFVNEDLTASHYRGKYNASTNTPTLADGVGQIGDYFEVNIPGTQDYGSGPIVLKANDWLHYNAIDGVWQKWINNSQAPTSTDSVTEGATNLYFTTARVLATVLSGLSLATGGAIVSTDTILQAFGKIQKQINDLSTIYQQILTDSNFGSFINGLTAKTTPVDADSIFIVDSAASNVGKKTLLSDFKAFLRSYFESFFFKYVVKSTATSSAVTGTTASTVIVSNIPIAANEVLPGDVLEVRVRMVKTGTGGTSSFNVGVSPNINETAANLAGPNQKICNGIISTAINTYAQSKSELIVKSATDTRTYGFGTGIGTDDIVNIVSTITAANIPWSGLLYFNISITNNSLTDSTVIQYYELIRKRG